MKWAVLHALLARGLRHLGGSSFRQVPTLLTKLGDELVIVRWYRCCTAVAMSLYCSEYRKNSTAPGHSAAMLVAPEAVPGT